jgi:hypothetical protein
MINSPIIYNIIENLNPYKQIINNIIVDKFLKIKVGKTRPYRRNLPLLEKTAPVLIYLSFPKYCPILVIFIGDYLTKSNII